MGYALGSFCYFLSLKYFTYVISLLSFILAFVFFLSFRYGFPRQANTLGGGAGKDTHQGQCIRCHKGQSGMMKKVHFCHGCKLHLNTGQKCVYTLLTK
jgi:hypothetical protein